MLEISKLRLPKGVTLRASSDHIHAVREDGGRLCPVVYLVSWNFPKLRRSIFGVCFVQGNPDQMGRVRTFDLTPEVERYATKSDCLDQYVAMATNLCVEIPLPGWGEQGSTYSVAARELGLRPETTGFHADFDGDLFQAFTQTARRTGRTQSMDTTFERMLQAHNRAYQRIVDIETRGSPVASDTQRRPAQPNRGPRPRNQRW